MPTPLATPSPTARAASKSTFTHVTDVILDIKNVTKALKKDGIKDISGILMLDDAQVEDLTYLDPNNPTAYYLEKEEIGLIIMYALL
jgi:histidinol-phosphate/aromatic aminotransferase/cobyric acid decarboxylase-like protein